MWFKPTPFHQTAKWAALAEKHKQICRDKGIFFCAFCGATEGLQSDHKVPVSQRPGLGLQIRNLQILCAPCNQRKGAKLLIDFPTVRVLTRVSFTRAVKRLMRYLIGLGVLFVLWSNPSILADSLALAQWLYQGAQYCVEWTLYHAGK